MEKFNLRPIKNEMKFEDLAKIDIRIGEIREVLDIPKSNNLMKLIVDFGDHTRMIIAGIKQERENPGEIQGKQALFVVNLPVKKIFGEKSEGMLFDIGYENKIIPVLAVPEKHVPNGSSAG
ncbi:MAG: tRNA-binding protein [Candidatus Atribacteria bacterium]|nr:tRNA-binding protein [Candidatus Atribacteria bacterium]